MDGIPMVMGDSVSENEINTLRFYPGKCVNCEMCTRVCPHGVFALGANRVELAHPQACMECGACQVNCPVNAIQVDSGVGCASAMIKAALTGKEVTCGGEDGCCN